MKRYSPNQLYKWCAATPMVIVVTAGFGALTFSEAKLGVSGLKI